MIGSSAWSFLIPGLVVVEKACETWAMAGYPGGELIFLCGFAEYGQLSISEGSTFS